jgi:hypothetical protein
MRFSPRQVASPHATRIWARARGRSFAALDLCADHCSRDPGVWTERDKLQPDPCAHFEPFVMVESRKTNPSESRPIVLVDHPRRAAAEPTVEYESLFAARACSRRVRGRRFRREVVRIVCRLARLARTTLCGSLHFRRGCGQRRQRRPFTRRPSAVVGGAASLGSS